MHANIGRHTFWSKPIGPNKPQERVTTQYMRSNTRPKRIMENIPNTLTHIQATERTYRLTHTYIFTLFFMYIRIDAYCSHRKYSYLTHSTTCSLFRTWCAPVQWIANWTENRQNHVLFACGWLNAFYFLHFANVFLQRLNDLLNILSITHNYTHIIYTSARKSHCFA